MTEEKRIIVSRHGALSCLYPTGDNKPLWQFSDGFTPVPVTKTELKNIVTNHMFGLDSQVIDFIGIDEFWDMYSKPVSEKKYNVIVPHTIYEMYCKNDLGLSVVSDEGDLDYCEFTESEIKKYHLEDCEKVPVDGSSK